MIFPSRPCLLAFLVQLVLVNKMSLFVHSDEQQQRLYLVIKRVNHIDPSSLDDFVADVFTLGYDKNSNTMKVVNETIHTAIHKVKSIVLDFQDVLKPQRKRDSQLSSNTESLREEFSNAYNFKQNDQRLVYYTRSSRESHRDVTSGSDTIIWHGFSSPYLSKEEALSFPNQSLGIGYASLLVREDGDLFGSFTTHVATYSLSSTSLSFVTKELTSHRAYRIVETLWKHLPPEQVVPEFRRDKGDNDDSTKVQLEKEGETFFSPDAIVYSQHFDEEAERLLMSRNTSRLLTANDSTQKKILIDVLVYVTNRARCELAGTVIGCPLNATNKAPIDSKIALVESQTNKVFNDLSMNIQIRIVAIIYLQKTSDFFSNSTLPLRVMEQDNATMVWRNKTGADLIAMITGTTATNNTNSSSSCGIARSFTGYTSATDYRCLDSYSFTAQLGRNFDANPNRENTTKVHEYAHAFRYKNVLRTILAASCGVGSLECPRYPYFSTDKLTITINNDDVPLGNSTNNNARRIAETAPIIEQYRETTKALPPTPSPTRSKKSQTCDPVDGNPKGWFFYKRCRKGMNPMFRQRFLIVCVQRCVEEAQVQFHLQTGWKCGRCDYRFQRKRDEE